MKYQQTELLQSVAKALPPGTFLPQFRFSPRTHEWWADDLMAEGIGITLEESLHAWVENAKSIREAEYGEGHKWNEALKLLEPYAPPIDTTYPITFSETGL